MMQFLLSSILGINYPNPSGPSCGLAVNQWEFTSVAQVQFSVDDTGGSSETHVNWGIIGCLKPLHYHLTRASQSSEAAGVDLSWSKATCQHLYLLSNLDPRSSTISVYRLKNSSFEQSTLPMGNSTQHLYLLPNLHFQFRGDPLPVNSFNRRWSLFMSMFLVRLNPKV